MSRRHLFFICVAIVGMGILLWYWKGHNSKPAGEPSREIVLTVKNAQQENCLFGLLPANPSTTATGGDPLPELPRKTLFSASKRVYELIYSVPLPGVYRLICCPSTDPIAGAVQVGCGVGTIDALSRENISLPDYFQIPISFTGDTTGLISIEFREGLSDSLYRCPVLVGRDTLFDTKKRVANWRYAILSRSFRVFVRSDGFGERYAGEISLHKANITIEFEGTGNGNYSVKIVHR